MGTLQGGAGASKKQVGSRLKILYQPSIFDGWYFFTQKWEVSSWIARTRTASITRKRKRRAISWDAICLVAATAPEDIVRSSSARKESRCGMEKSNVEKVAEEIIEENKRLKKEIDDRGCQIKEMQNHIDRLKADLAEAQDNKIELPHEPIKVAEMLIDATGTYKTNSLSRAFGAGDIGTYNLYSKSDLRQIAEHLLVYCNNAEDE